MTAGGKRPDQRSIPSHTGFGNTEVFSPWPHVILLACHSILGSDRAGSSRAGFKPLFEAAAQSMAMSAWGVGGTGLRRPENQGVACVEGTLVSLA